MHTGRIRLTRAAKRLREQWETAREAWNDGNTRDFDQNHLQPLTPQLTLMLAAIHRMSDVLEQAERECSDEEERV